MRVVVSLGALVGLLSLLVVDVFLLLLNGFESTQEGRIFLLPIPVMVIGPLAIIVLLVLALRREEAPLRQPKAYLQVWLCASTACVLLCAWEMTQILAADISGMAGLVVLILAPALLLPALVVASLFAWVAVSMDWKAIATKLSSRVRKLTQGH